MTAIVEAHIRRGSTFEMSMLYASDKVEIRQIEGVVSLVPLRLTVTAHGLPDGWPVDIECVKRPQEMNATDLSIAVVDADTVEVSGVHGDCWRAWDNTGVIRFPSPGDLTGISARAMFRKNIRDADPIITLHSSEPADGRIILDAVEHSITLSIPYDFTASLPLIAGVWDMELFDGSEWVHSIVDVSPFVVTDEVTRHE